MSQLTRVNIKSFEYEIKQLIYMGYEKTFYIKLQVPFSGTTLALKQGVDLNALCVHGMPGTQYDRPMSVE